MWLWPPRYIHKVADGENNYFIINGFILRQHLYILEFVDRGHNDYFPFVNVACIYNKTEKLYSPIILLYSNSLLSV
jgi:hypothetical protein